MRPSAQARRARPRADRFALARLLELLHGAHWSLRVGESYPTLAIPGCEDGGGGEANVKGQFHSNQRRTKHGYMSRLPWREASLWHRVQHGERMPATHDDRRFCSGTGSVEAPASERWHRGEALCKERVRRGSRPRYWVFRRSSSMILNTDGPMLLYVRSAKVGAPPLFRQTRSCASGVWLRLKDK
jgi:hypothetical protein